MNEPKYLICKKYLFPNIIRFNILIAIINRRCILFFWIIFKFSSSISRWINRFCIINNEQSILPIPIQYQSINCIRSLIICSLCVCHSFWFHHRFCVWIETLVLKPTFDETNVSQRMSNLWREYFDFVANLGILKPRSWSQFSNPHAKCHQN